MSKYAFVYRAPVEYESASPAEMGDWQRFLEGLGSHLIDAGNPVFTRGSVGNCGVETVLGGYSIVTADDLPSAMALARACPTLAAGGGVEVGEITELSATSTVTTADDHARATSGALTARS
jgi:hypothetical protein